MRYRGVAYYPEAWPAERWDQDIALMREAGINLVRMGEFAWSRFEPREGAFNLDWWREICDRMRAADLRVLACTPSAAPPAWLTTDYPDVVAVDADGTRPAHGTRRHYCPTSTRYRQHIATINGMIAAAVRDNPAIIGWQIDNEIAPTPMCHCENCAEAFRGWLQARYGSLDALNTAWGNVFWSGDFSDWSQIQPPRHRVSWQLDYQRFYDDAFKDFILAQTQTLRRIQPDWTLTTNLWAGLNPATNAALLADQVDVASYDGYWDVYADRETYSSVWDLYRNIKSPRRPFWLAETGAWNPCRTVDNALAALRPWAFEAFAKGSEAQVFFRWRQSRMGEENHPAVLDWTGRPGRSYAQVRSIFREFQSLEAACRDLPLPQPQAAVLFDYDTAAISRLSEAHTRYHNRVTATNIDLNRMQVIADILPVRQGLDLKAYRLLVLPSLECVDEWLAALLADFVRTGGTILAQTRLAVRDRNGKYLTDIHPAGMVDLFGVDVRERCPVQPRHRETGAAEASVALAAHASLDLLQQTAQGIEHMEMLSPADDVTTLAEYASGDYTGAPAITERQQDEGWAIYQGCMLDGTSRRRVLTHALQRAGIDVPTPTPAGVEIIPRHHLRFYLNHNPTSVSVPLVRCGQPLVGTVEQAHARLEGFGVCVVDESRD